ncbi:MAG: aquaporin family protein [Actinomycetota bacterium]|nr:aquaporin family protein [Actinomycetota bacterium]
MHPLGRRLVAEFLGTLLLVAIVVGSGIAASRLSPTDHGLQLLENAAATALGLFVLIAVLAPISGAHLNPLVSLVDAGLGRRPWSDVVAYIPVQIVGAILGAFLANLMFGLPAGAISTTDRLTPGHALAEVVATAGLIAIIFVLARTERSAWTPAAVAAWIGSAYFFASSTSFANPAVTVGRIFTDTFAGITPVSALGYILAQMLGAAIGLCLVLVLSGSSQRKENF